MLEWIIAWLLSALVLLLLARLLPGFSVAGYGTALIAALVIAALNATLGLLLKIVTFPLTFITIGLFLFVIDALILKLAAAILPGFSIRGCLPAILAAVLLALIAFAMRLAFGGNYPWW